MKLDKIITELKALNKLSELQKEKLVKFSDNIAYELKKDGLKTHQIRKFWSAINKIKSKTNTQEDEKLKDKIIKEEAIMLKPKLAYATGRKREVKKLMKVLEPCIDRIKNSQDFNVFIDFVESIVAYHKYHGEN